jgi:hypothetical protein
LSTKTNPYDETQFGQREPLELRIFANPSGLTGYSARTTKWPRYAHLDPLDTQITYLQDVNRREQEEYYEINSMRKLLPKEVMTWASSNGWVSNTSRTRLLLHVLAHLASAQAVYQELKFGTCSNFPGLKEVSISSQVAHALVREFLGSLEYQDRFLSVINIYLPDFGEEQPFLVMCNFNSWFNKLDPTDFPDKATAWIHLSEVGVPIYLDLDPWDLDGEEYEMNWPDVLNSTDFPDWKFAYMRFDLYSYYKLTKSPLLTPPNQEGFIQRVLLDDT